MYVLLLFSAKLYYLCPAFDEWSDARVAEEARLESVYTSKAYPEFESRSLRLKGRHCRPFLYHENKKYKIHNLHLGCHLIKTTRLVVTVILLNDRCLCSLLCDSLAEVTVVGNSIYSPRWVSTLSRLVAIPVGATASPTIFLKSFQTDSSR